MELDTKKLFEEFEKNRALYSQDLSLRLHRAMSWFTAAQERKDDLDMAFISLWISFNAVYADDFGKTVAERNALKMFIGLVCKLDRGEKLSQLVWETYANTIRLLLDNKFVFQPFWDAQNTSAPNNAWEKRFSRERKQAKKALANGKTEVILGVLFNRLYTLRNQILHGGATYKGSTNIQQKKDGCAILFTMLPIVFEIIIQNPTDDWGKPYYPVITD